LGSWRTSYNKLLCGSKRKRPQNEAVIEEAAFLL